RIISTTCSLKLASKTLRFDFVTFIFSGDFHLSVCTKLLDQDSLLASTPVALYASMKAPGKTWAEILAASRATPDRLTFASFGPGSSSHLYAELLQSLTGVKWLHIAYKGPSPAMQALIGGEVDLMFDTLSSGMPQALAGRIRSLAVASAVRAPVAPDLPTFEELKVSGLDGGPWFALFAPKETPPSILKVLSESVHKSLGSSVIAKRLAGQGIAVINQGPVELASFQKQEIARWAENVKRFNIKVD
ncbi:tripartite tricarboxylate transporter substrate binding protein, partial [Rhodoferax ferrireducens]|uniref:tripartite tricarboxylate transporter substrate binding protein n=1 Tax=Rhodoferax ferrireducens TaxID=192843 RepID=UPI001E4B47C3